MNIFFILIPKLTFLFSNKSFFKGAYLMAQFYFFFFLTRILKVKTSVIISISYMENHLKFELREYLDFAALQEVFIDGEYAWFPIENPKYILDLGGHIGDTAIFYAGHYPNSIIISVEPDTENYKRLISNCATLKNVIPVNAAVSTDSGITKFYKKSSGSLGSSTVANQSLDIAEYEVETVSIPELQRKYQIDIFDIIKFDIEGGEKAMFPNDINPESLSRNYIGEYHEDLTGEKISDFRQLFTNSTIEIVALKKNGRYSFKSKSISLK